MIQDYFQKVEQRLSESEIIADKRVDYSEFSEDEGMLRGRLLFIDGSVLEFMEYLSKEERLKYRFHLMDEDGKMVFRYDNAPHHNVSTFPHHKHLPGSVVESESKGIIPVLDEAERMMATRQDI